VFPQFSLSLPLTVPPVLAKRLETLPAIKTFPKVVTDCDYRMPSRRFVVISCDRSMPDPEVALEWASPRIRNEKQHAALLADRILMNV
jgi:hypothetical protein